MHKITEKINTEEIIKGLKTSFIGSEIVYREKTDSTNRLAKDLADNGAAEGALVIAEEQTKGRGRLNRAWLSEPHRNILMSLVLRPGLQPSKAFSLTMAVSISVVKAIEKTTGLNAKIKWPNDIYYNNKKLAGILTELNADRHKINYAVVGIGINVNSDPGVYPDIAGTATSLYKETGKITPRTDLLRTILIEIEKTYSLIKKNKIKNIHKKWNALSLISGRHVTIYSDKHAEEGTALSVSEDGTLILLKNNGEKKNIFCGDVSLRFE